MTNYQGKDLIFAMGAPGSRWSGSIRCIQTSIDINSSDDRIHRNYDRDDNGKTYGWHRGAYWGPNHEFGKSFDILHTITKDEFIEEIKKPFLNWNNGTKIIKSHWFSYNIPLLREWFPEAKLLAFYMPDDFCFDWWHKVGGWNITYPHYDWYINDERMQAQIKIENENIKKEFTNIKNRTLTELQIDLGLSTKLISNIDEWDNKIPELTKRYNKTSQELLNSTVQRTATGIL